jgi:hypothetical protein
MAKLEAAVLANSALDHGGVVSMLGAFVSRVGGPEFPVRSQLFFVGRVQWEDADYGTHVVMLLRVEHSLDGEQLARFEATMFVDPEFRTAPGVDPQMPIGSNLVLPLFMEFRRAGMYLVTLTVNGEPLAELPLKVEVAIPSH